MSIYSSTHSGVILNAVTLSNLNLGETDLRGYFSKDALGDLITNNSNCVGLRIYNINPSTKFPSLLAVCVSENGADMQIDDTHSICNSINDASDRAIVLSRQLAHDDIIEGYTFAVNESEKYSSYFSKTMLQNLLNSSPHSGVAFYKVISLGGRSTHLAVTSDLDQNINSVIKIVGLNGAGFNNCLSDQPCPGHCVNMDQNGNEVVESSPLVSTPGDLTSHYIPIWH